ISSSRAALGLARNRSKSLVPFNKFPDEIAAHILSFLDIDSNSDIRYDTVRLDNQSLSSLLNVSATSKRLRELAIGTPSLWTRIDLIVDQSKDTYLQHGRHFLSYSKQLPLRIRIAGDVDENDEDQKVAKCLTSLFALHANRIASLDFQVPLTCAWKVILGLFSDTSSCQIRELYVNDPDAFPEGLDEGFPEQFFGGDLDCFLRSLRIIGMRGFLIPFNTPAYRDLTVLKIMPFEFREPRPTLPALRGALAACPQLRSLALIECMFEISTGVPIDPVLLPNLEVLDLRVTSNDNELVALSCISSGSDTLTFSVSLDLGMFEDTMAKLQCFIEQSNVTRLCVDATLDSTDDLDWWFASPKTDFSAIQELALCSYLLEGSSFKRPFDASRFPSLHTLHLLGCGKLDARHCRQILGASVIHALWMDEPHTAIPELSEAIPSVGYRRYSTNISHGGGDLEWPLYIFE
ncbi:hypothetical protein FRC07_007279, partial [Ceratobasidium sp. 392]